MPRIDAHQSLSHGSQAPLSTRARGCLPNGVCSARILQHRQQYPSRCSSPPLLNALGQPPPFDCKVENDTCIEEHGKEMKVAEHRGGRDHMIWYVKEERKLSKWILFKLYLISQRLKSFLSCCPYDSFLFQGLSWLLHAMCLEITSSEKISICVAYRSTD